MTGTVDREIITLAGPAALALATEPLYEICDTAILGHVGTAPLAGAAIAVRVLSFGYAAFVFLMFATTAAVARRDGAGDDRGADEESITAMWIALAIGVASATLFAVVGRSAIGWLGGTGRVADLAWTYLAISLAGLPAHTLVMAGVGARRGRHDTRSPLVVAAVTVALNLVLEVVLILGLGFGLGASALGTVIAKWLGAIVYVVVLRRSARRTRASWRPTAIAIRSQLTVGRDLVVRTVVLLGVFAVAQAVAARSGVSALAAHTIAFQLWMLGVYATDGLEAAGQTMVAHRIGAGRTDEIPAVVRRLLAWAVGLGVVLAAALVATRSLVPDGFTDDTVVATTTAGLLWWVAALQPVNATAFTLDGVLVGAGRQRALAAAMAVAAVAFVVVVAIGDRRGWGLHGVWAAFAAFMVVRLGTGAALGARVAARSTPTG